MSCLPFAKGDSMRRMKCYLAPLLLSSVEKVEVQLLELHCALTQSVWDAV